MYSYETRTGQFGYRRNCSIPHFIPQGLEHDGYPVIVFPQRNSDVTVGKTYDFTIKPTRAATYTIDGEVYRVAHAIAPRDINDEEGTIFDQIECLEKPTTFTLGERFPPELVERMRQMATARA